MSPDSNNPAASILMQRRIEWWDTDASGSYHNTAASRLLESAETLLLGRLGILDDVYRRLPRAHVEADFLRPLRFHDQVDVHLRVSDMGRSSITYRNRDPSRGRGVRADAGRGGPAGRTRRKARRMAGTVPSSAPHGRATGPRAPPAGAMTLLRRLPKRRGQ